MTPTHPAALADYEEGVGLITPCRKQNVHSINYLLKTQSHKQYFTISPVPSMQDFQEALPVG